MLEQVIKQLAHAATAQPRWLLLPGCLQMQEQNPSYLSFSEPGALCCSWCQCWYSWLAALMLTCNCDLRCAHASHLQQHRIPWQQGPWIYLFRALLTCFWRANCIYIYGIWLDSLKSGALLCALGWSCNGIRASRSKCMFFRERVGLWQCQACLQRHSSHNYRPRQLLAACKPIGVTRGFGWNATCTARGESTLETHVFDKLEHNWQRTANTARAEALLLGYDSPARTMTQLPRL